MILICSYLYDYFFFKYLTKCGIHLSPGLFKNVGQECLTLFEAQLNPEHSTYL